jgi:hypothetical protein
VEKSADTVVRALLRSHVTFSFGHPEGCPIVTAGSLDLKQTPLATRLERKDVVTGAVPLDIRHPADLVRQSSQASALKLSPFKTDHKLLTGTS